MIYLNPGITNSVVVTLKENTRSPNPYYTWLITDIVSKQDVIVFANDISPTPDYYNQFLFSVVNIPPTERPTGSTYGTIYTNSGEYEYMVYEMQYPYVLATASALGVVERGLLIINGTYSGPVTNTDTGDSVIVNKSLD